MPGELRDVTSEALRAANGLMAWIPCARLTAVNWTPWWGGDYEGKVRDPQTLQVTSLPRSETIRGVLRWVLRAALNAHLDIDIEALDEALAPIYGGVARREGREEHLDSLVRITVESRLNSSCDKQQVQAAARLIDKRREQTAYQHLGSRKDDYTKILTVPRIELTFMGSKDPRYRKALLPVPAGCIETRVTIEVAAHKFGSLSGFYREPPAAGEVCALTTAALIYALMVKGIGRGANRGFGRFRVEEIHFNRSLVDDSLASRLESITRGLADSSKVEIALREIHELLVSLSRRLATYHRTRDFRRCGGCAPSLRIVGREGVKHGVITRVVRNARHPAPVPVRALPSLRGKGRILDVYDALSAIGKAFMKNVWKIWCRVHGVHLKSPGIGLHSWVAGLPRWQQETGYVIIRRLVGGEQDDNLCLKRDDLKNRGVADPGRRQSSIIAYPMPDNPSTVVLVAYVTSSDHLRYLREEGLPALYHSGCHGKPKDTPERHVVRLTYAARQQYVPPKQGCGSDSPAGVVYPDKLDVARSPQELVIKAYESVVEHIVNALS